MPRSVTILPPEEQSKLRAVREAGDLPELRQRILALRMKEWPLRAIGEPLAAPRSTVRMWEKGADPAQPVPEVPECQRAERSRGERVVRLRIDVPELERDELRRLAEAARRVRGRTPKASPDRLAADRLDHLIEKYMARDVPVKRIAEHMGVTPRAVTARRERYLARQAKKEHPAT